MHLCCLPLHSDAKIKYTLSQNSEAYNKVLPELSKKRITGLASPLHYTGFTSMAKIFKNE